MTAIITRPNTREKLEILSEDAQYDLACACGTNKLDRRKRGEDGKWVYPVTLPSGGSSVLFKTLLSNVCSNDCKYCPLRSDMDVRRCSLSPEETARTFIDYHRAGKVFGLFLSSGVIGTPDNTMDKLNAVARIARRKHGFRGYIHLKVIPGASAAAIEETLSLASAVSLNIETAGKANFERLSDRKDYIRDIIEPIKLISRLTAKGSRFERVKQTTQFIVGAAGESDRQIVEYMGGLYTRLNMQRIYFSGYQAGLGSPELPAERQAVNPADILTREHRLYQVDFLLRRYGFGESDIVYANDGRLSLTTDPKELWAAAHPEFFPVDVNRADRFELLRVPGLGPTTVKRILEQRRIGRISSVYHIGRPNKLLSKAATFLKF